MMVGPTPWRRTQRRSTDSSCTSVVDPCIALHHPVVDSARRSSATISRSTDPVPTSETLAAVRLSLVLQLFRRLSLTVKFIRCFNDRILTPGRQRTGFFDNLMIRAQTYVLEYQNGHPQPLHTILMSGIEPCGHSDIPVPVPTWSKLTTET